MLDYNQIKDLIKEIDSSSLRVFELEDSDIKLKLSKNDENKPTNDLINDVYQNILSNLEIIKDEYKNNNLVIKENGYEETCLFNIDNSIRIYIGIIFKI